MYPPHTHVNQVHVFAVVVTTNFYVALKYNVVAVDDITIARPSDLNTHWA